MNNNYKKFEFEIQPLKICRGSNGDNVYTVSYSLFKEFRYKV